jgi:hypothetical protein
MCGCRETGLAALDALTKHDAIFVMNLETDQGYRVLDVVRSFEKASGRPVSVGKPAVKQGISSLPAVLASHRRLACKAFLSCDTAPVTESTRSCLGTPALRPASKQCIFCPPGSMKLRSGHASLRSRRPDCWWPMVTNR